MSDTLREGIQRGIKAMLAKFTDCPSANILAGYNNKVPLPSDNDYIIFTIMNPIRLGTPVEKHTSTPAIGTMTSYQDYRVDVQIDFYGDFSFKRANDIMNLGRTMILCDFLKAYDIQPIECENAQNMTSPSGEGEYVKRWMVLLSIDYRDAVIVSQDCFNTAELNIFETEI